MNSALNRGFTRPYIKVGEETPGLTVKRNLYFRDNLALQGDIDYTGYR